MSQPPFPPPMASTSRTGRAGFLGATVRGQGGGEAWAEAPCVLAPQSFSDHEAAPLPRSVAHSHSSRCWWPRLAALLLGK